MTDKHPSLNIPEAVERAKENLWSEDGRILARDVLSLASRIDAALAPLEAALEKEPAWMTGPSENVTVALVRHVVKALRGESDE